MNLTIVLSRLLLVQVFAPAFCVEVACNAERVRAMRLRQTRDNALVLGQIPVGIGNRQIGMVLAQAVVKAQSTA